DWIYITINASTAGNVTNTTDTLVRRSNWGNLVEGENELILRRRHDGSYTIAQDTGLLDQDQVKDLPGDLAGKADALHTHAASEIDSGTFAAARLAGGTASS